MKDWIDIALPKGRIGEEAYELLKKAGFDCPDMMTEGRKLIFENESNRLRFFWAKPSDVAVYVERGAADIGIVGKDILLEDSYDVYELLDLGIGCCRMAVAGPRGFRYPTDSVLRVATKFPNIAKEWFSGRGREIEIIKLHGSIEIAPMLRVSDVIVDIVQTGATLRENDMEVLEDITPISSRLIANKISYRFKDKRITALAAALKR